MISLALIAALAAASTASHPWLERVALPGEANILEEAHFGIVNGRLTVGTPYRNTVAISGFFAPPWASSNFWLEMRLYGERVPASSYRWYPMEVRRKGKVRDLAVSSTTALVPGRRALVVAVTLENGGRQAAEVPVQLDFLGSLAYVKRWEFARPTTEKSLTVAEGGATHVVRRNGDGALAVASDFPAPRWEGWSSHWESRVSLAPGESKTYHVAVAAGKEADALTDCREVMANPARILAAARDAYERELRGLFEKVPRLEASNPRLVKYYDRGLMHLVLNKWRVPEFLLNPYYSTGSVLGGCLGNYLWDFGEPWEIFPLYDPEASKTHIRQFLSIDLTKHFLFDPFSGEGGGPLYPVNQEKIIHLVYYYVLHTGDVAFLKETVKDRTVVDWMVFHALFDDDKTRPVALLDYGDGNHHLELRGKLRYDFVVPDLNGRRYANYVRAYELARMTGQDHPYLLERAEQVKRLLRETLWSPSDRWYYMMNRQGVKDLRYTVQMFKLIGSPVLGDEEMRGLVSHLNEDEFLSEYGLHSMSKKDAAYDQVDLDNGGGGIFNAFVPQIAERLYRAGLPAVAEDLLHRVLWWGERVPYWSDSFSANQVEYRKDTPLQSTFDAAAAAQAVIFGMFGIQVKPDGDIVVNPRPPKFSPMVALRGVRLRGRVFDVVARPDGFEVNGRRSPIGTPVIIRGQR